MSNFTNKQLKAAVAVLFMMVMAACSTTPERISELEQARTFVQKLESEPLARQAASTQLAKSRTALQRAEAHFEEGEPADLVRHEAYVARRHAEIGLEMVAEAQAIDELQEARAERKQVQLEARTYEAERAEMLARKRADEAEKSAREAELSRSVAEAAIEEADRLAAQLKDMEAQKTERGLVLTLSDVLFDTNKAQLKAGASRTIDRLANFLQENPERHLLIEGHTDARGSDEYNLGLSSDRAAAVTAALIERGIERERLRSVGLGESYPVAGNDSAAGMQENRRVEIVVSRPDGSFPASAEKRAQGAQSG